MSEHEVRVIKAAEMLSLLERARDERGSDFIYLAYTKIGPACLYVRDDARFPNRKWGDSVSDHSPACIVGLALSYIDDGRLVPVLEEWQFDCMNDDGNSSAINLNDALTVAGARLTHRAKKVAVEAQMRQDAGKTWGAAVDVATIWASSLTYSDD